MASNENYTNGLPTVDPFYPDGYNSTEQDRRRISAQKEKYAPAVGSINFKFPLKSVNRGFFQGNKTTITAIREDIKTLLMTVKGERLMNKDMGTNIPVLAGQLFEPIHKIELLEKESIKLSIKNLYTYPFIKKLIDIKSLEVHGLWYDIAKGKLFYLNIKTNNFEEVV